MRVDGPTGTVAEAAMKVEAIMRRTVVTVRPEAPLRDVARVLVEHGISGVPVVDAGGAVLGVVSIDCCRTW